MTTSTTFWYEQIRESLSVKSCGCDPVLVFTTIIVKDLAVSTAVSKAKKSYS